MLAAVGGPTPAGRAAALGKPGLSVPYTKSRAGEGREAIVLAVGTEQRTRGGGRVRDARLAKASGECVAGAAGAVVFARDKEQCGGGGRHDAAVARTILKRNVA